jgi:peptide deformylase
MMPALKQRAPHLRLYRREWALPACRLVERSDDIEPLVREMTRICHTMRAGGLSAPQLGVNLRLAVVMTESGMAETLINPEIVNLAGRDLLAPEGCLSLPPHNQAMARVWRSEIVQVRTGTAEDPGARLLRDYHRQAARLVQHEIDHLEGVFFIDRCGPIARSIVLRQFDRCLRSRAPHPLP